MNVPGRFWVECHEDNVPHHQPLVAGEDGFHLAFSDAIEDETDCKTFQNFWMCLLCVLPNHLRTKFDIKAVRCIFVAYDNKRKCWRCCDPTTERIYTSRNVVFDEALAWWPSKNMIQLDLGQPEASIRCNTRRPGGCKWRRWESNLLQD